MPTHTSFLKYRSFFGFTESAFAPYVFMAASLMGYSKATAQKVTGKVYDDQAVVPYVKVINITQSDSTYTNEDGDFKINATLNDSLYFSAPFHEEWFEVIEDRHLDEDFVVELKKSTNALAEVFVTHEKSKPFDPVTYQADFALQLENDLKERPYLYKPPPSTNFNILGVIGLLGRKLFPPKEGDSAPVFLTAEDLQELFESDHALFTTHFLVEELKIPAKYHFMFFSFCEAKEIPHSFLSEENKLKLLESFLEYAPVFLENLEER